MNAKAKGARGEHKTRKLLEEDGWIVVRPGASLGPADLFALKRGERPRAIQVKCGGTNPYMNFRPAERAELIRYAEQAGAVPELCWYAANRRGQPSWIESAVWP